MSSQNPSPDYAWPPSVMGFDMPSPSARGRDGDEPVMVAFLSVHPDNYWIEAFCSEVHHFKQQHQLVDVQMDAQCLVVIGPAGILRNLTADVRSFVNRVSRAGLQRRVMDRVASEDILARSVTETAAAQHDLDLVARMPGMNAMLEAVARETGMRIAAVARVSDTRWTACAVYDAIDFGLQAGQDLALETTICNEIRQHGRPVMFNNASQHPVFSRHRTPALYGFESYISVPIFRKDGQFFGTLCALDPQPRQLGPATVQTIEKFARAIGAEIDGELPLPQPEIEPQS